MSSTEGSDVRGEVLDGVVPEETVTSEDGTPIVVDELADGLVELVKATKTSTRDEFPGGEEVQREVEEELIRHDDTEDHGGDPDLEPVQRGTIIVTLYENMPAKVVFKGKKKPLGAREINDAAKWMNREYRRQRGLWAREKEKPNVS